MVRLVIQSMRPKLHATISPSRTSGRIAWNYMKGSSFGRPCVAERSSNQGRSERWEFRYFDWGGFHLQDNGPFFQCSGVLCEDLP